MNLTINGIILFSVCLFGIGLFGYLVRKNAIVVFMCVEIMLNAANFLIVGFSSYHRHLDGVMLAFFMLVIAAVEAVVGLSLILMLSRHKNNLNVDEFKTLS